jgi:nucleotide-binding universal stress UspA family protein
VVGSRRWGPWARVAMGSTSHYLAHHAVVPAEDVPAALTALARDVGACVLVLGRDLEGRVARAVLDRAPCPVAVSPFTVAVGAGAFLVDASEAYDLLVCGSRGRGRVVAALLGSTSGRLVDGAHGPVLVVPPRVRRDAGRPLGLTTAGR